MDPDGTKEVWGVGAPGMSTRNITVRPSHSAHYYAMERNINKQLKEFGAKTFGSLARREERLERFQVAAAKKEARQKAAQERLEAARQTEFKTVADRMRTRAAELKAEQDLADHIEFVTSGMEAEEFLQWKVSEAWATYRAAKTQDERHHAREEVNRAMSNLRDFHEGNPLHVLAATAEMLNAYGSDSDNEGSDYTEEHA